MAAKNVPPGNKPIKSLEYSIVQANYDYLVDAVQPGLRPLAKKAYDKGLLDDNSYTVILESKALSKDLKARMLVESVSDKIDRNIRHFTDFVCMLREVPILDKVADRLTQAMAEVYSVQPSRHQPPSTRPPPRQPSSRHSPLDQDEPSPKGEQRPPIDSGIITELSTSANPTSEIDLLASNDTAHESVNLQDIQPLLNPMEAQTGSQQKPQEMVTPHQLSEFRINLSGTNLEGQPNFPTRASGNALNDFISLETPCEEGGGISFLADEADDEDQAGIQETRQGAGADVLDVQGVGDHNLFADKDLTDLRTHVRNLQRELSSSKAENQTKDQSIRELEQKIVELSVKIEDLLDQLTNQKDEVVRITSQKDEQIHSVKLKFDSLKEKYKRLKEQQAKTEREKNQQYEKYEKKVAEYVERQVEAENEIERIKLDHDAQINQLKTKLEETTSQREQARNELCNLRVKIEKKEKEKISEVAKQEKTIHSLQLQVRDLQIELKEKEKQIAEKNAQIAELKQTKAEEEKQKAEECTEKAVADKEKAEEDKQQAVADKEKAEKERKQAVEDKEKAEEQARIQKSESQARIQELERLLGEKQSKTQNHDSTEK